MHHGGAWVSFPTIFAIAALFPAASFGGRSCESLASLELPSTTITKAQSVPAGPFQLGGPFPGQRQVEFVV